MIRRSVPLLLLGLILTAPVVHAATLERDFTFASDQFTLHTTGPYTGVAIKGGAPLFTAGQPDLPWVSEQIDVPSGMRITGIEATVVGSPWGEHVRLPAAWTFSKELGSAVRSLPDPIAFSRSGFQPQRAVELGNQGWMRGRRVASLRVCPVRWDAATGKLERVERVHVVMQLAPATDAPAPRLRVVPEWNGGDVAPPTAGGTVVSHFAATRGGKGLSATQIPSLLGSPVAYVIITSDDLAGEFQRLADWKTQSGVPAVVRTLSFIRAQYPRGADDAERIRDFIRDAYSRWGTVWVLLGGDTDVIPVRYARETYYGGADIASDLYYSCLDGNWDANGNHLYCEGYTSDSDPGDNADLYPEVYVGRAPASNVAQAKLFVDRTLAYQKTPVGDYEKNVLIFAEVLFPEDWTSGGTLLDGGELGDQLLSEIGQNPSIRTTRLYQNYTASWAPPPPVYPETRKAVLDSLNKGYGYAVHIGHGFRNVMSLGDANIFNSDVQALTNGARLTNLYAVNCTSSAIDYPCIAEAFMQAPNGGAITSVGSTNLDFPYAARMFQSEFFSQVFDDSVTAAGEAQAKQKLPQIGFSTTDDAYRWEEQSILLLGDPELHMWTGTPRTLSVAAPSTFALDDTSIAVTVTISGQPLLNARVTAYKANDAYASGVTNAAGFVRLPFRVDSLGAISLTVTGYDCRPYLGSVNVTAVAASVIADGAPQIDDDAVGGTSGDGDGNWDAGETIDMRTPLKNAGGSTAPNVSATLSTGDALVTITTPTVAYGAIAAGATTTPAGAFRVSVPASCPDQREVPFTLTITDGAGHTRIEKVQLTVRSPDLRHFGHIESDNGNHNGAPDVGEVVTYTVKLANLGTAEAHQVTAVLRVHDGMSVVTDSTATWGDVPAGAENPAGDGVTFTPTNLAGHLELRVSDVHGLRFTQILDLIAPSTPLGLTALGKATSVDLTWTPNAEADLLGYQVYRATAQGGPYTRVSRVPTDRISRFEDGSLTPLSRYYYEVTSVDSSGNESPPSLPVAVSTNPPLHPGFPISMNETNDGPPAVDHIYPGYPLDIVAGSDVIYDWHPDGIGPVDADGAGATNGDLTTVGTGYIGGASIADLNGDGVKEVVGVASDSTQMVVVDPQGHTKAGWPQHISDGVWSSVAIGDLNNDGHKEMVFAGFTGAHLFVMRDNGTEWMDGDNNPSTLGVFKTLGAPYNIGTPAIADLDGNGVRDIIYGSFDSKLYAWRPDGTNLPGFPITLPEPITASVAIGYLDGPGDTQLDIVVVTGFYTNSTPAKDSLYVFTATGARRAGFPKPLRTSDNTKAPSPALADMNNDGFLDIVAASSNGKIYVWDRNGNVVGPWNGVPFSTLTSSATESSPVVADINGDGKNDVVIGDEAQSLMALSNDGTVLPGFPIQLPAALKSAPALCDCDGDGKTEIITSGSDKTVSMWDYDFPFSPGVVPPWPQFHHDAMRTGLASNLPWVSVDPIADAAPAATLELAAPSPNPTRAGSQIGYAIPRTTSGERVELVIYDLSGRKVRLLESGEAKAGRYRTAWNLSDDAGRRVVPGLYFAQLRVGSDRRAQKIIVVH